MSDTILQIKKSAAMQAFEKGTASEKEMLKNLLGKENLVQPNIMERIQTIEDVYRITGKTLVLRPDETVDEFAYRQAKLICEAYNEGTVLDPMDTNQRKYYAFHEIYKASGFGLSYDVCVNWSSHSDVGVRLCFAKSEHAVDAGKKFIEIYSNLKIK